MEIVLGLVAALPVTIAVLLAILRAGIHRQERTASLASQPRSLSAALTRRILGLHVSEPANFAHPLAAGRPVTNGKKACCR